MKFFTLIFQFLFFSLAFFVQLSYAGNPEITIINDRKIPNDSSFYDIAALDSNNFILVGKFGIIKTINRNGKIETIKNPLSGNDIYKIDKWDDENVIACSDKGYVLQYNLKNKTWQTLQIKGYENSCFYSMCVVDENTAYVCGGKSEIAHSLKVVPYGFILSTADKGKTWQKVYSNPIQMVWSISLDPVTKEINALIYQPNQAFIYSLNTITSKFEKKIKLGKGLYHDLDYDKNNNWLVVGGKHDGKGTVKNNILKKEFNCGLIWSYTKNKNRELFSTSNSSFILKENNIEKEYVLPLENNYGLYECAFFDEKKAIVVGSGQSIIFIDFKD
jgi:hypothetical protein